MAIDEPGGNAVAQRGNDAPNRQMLRRCCTHQFRCYTHYIDYYSSHSKLMIGVNDEMMAHKQDALDQPTIGWRRFALYSFLTFYFPIPWPTLSLSLRNYAGSIHQAYALTRLRLRYDYACFPTIPGRWDAMMGCHDRILHQQQNRALRKQKIENRKQKRRKEREPLIRSSSRFILSGFNIYIINEISPCVLLNIERRTPNSMIFFLLTEKIHLYMLICHPKGGYIRLVIVYDIMD